MEGLQWKHCGLSYEFKRNLFAGSRIRPRKMPIPTQNLGLWGIFNDGVEHDCRRRPLSVLSSLFWLQTQIRRERPGERHTCYSMSYNRAAYVGSRTGLHRINTYQFLAAALASLVTLASGHGIITTPVPRAIGAANLAACGTGVYNTLKSDKAGPIENAAAKVDSDYKAAACHLFFCRGLQFEDNKSNTRVYGPGTVVPFHVDIIAHHTGYANVSVVDLAAQRPIGKPLFNWPVYTNNSLGPADWPKNETDFEVTIPDLGTQCTKAGACAIQWWWYAYNGQTYESCIDFTTA